MRTFTGIRVDGSLVEAPRYVPVRETSRMMPQFDQWTRSIVDPLEESGEAWRPGPFGRSGPCFWGDRGSWKEHSDDSGPWPSSFPFDIDGVTVVESGRKNYHS